MGPSSSSSLSTGSAKTGAGPTLHSRASPSTSAVFERAYARRRFSLQSVARLTRSTLVSPVLVDTVDATAPCLAAPRLPLDLLDLLAA